MKNMFPMLLITFLLLLSCRNTEDSVQKIDQTVQIYIDSLGKDMLNQKIAGTYTTIVMKDIGGIYDATNISGFNLKKNSDTANYIEYLAGAKRNLVDSVSTTQKYYQSDIVLNLTKKINDTVSKTTVDTMKIQYSWTPQVFQVAKIYYNRQLVFSKTDDQPNIVKISK